MDTFQGDSAGVAKVEVVNEGSSVNRNLSPGTTYAAPPAPVPTPGTEQQGIFINAGGRDDYTDTDGNTWVPDANFVNTGRTYQKTVAISKTGKSRKDIVSHCRLDSCANISFSRFLQRIQPFTSRNVTLLR